VIAAEPPVRLVEQSTGAGGRCVTRGTYTLRELPGSATEVHFELVALAAPRGERLASPLARAWLRRGNAEAMRRPGAALAA